MKIMPRPKRLILCSSTNFVMLIVFRSSNCLPLPKGYLTNCSWECTPYENTRLMSRQRRGGNYPAATTRGSCLSTAVRPEEFECELDSDSCSARLKAGATKEFLRPFRAHVIDGIRIPGRRTGLANYGAFSAAFTHSAWMECLRGDTNSPTSD